MDVVDCGVNGFRVYQVPVIPTATLPEAVRDFSIRLFVSHHLQKARCLRPNESDGLAGDGSLHIQKDSANRVHVAERIDQEMHMLGHDHIGPQFEAMFVTCLGECIEKPSPRPVAM